MDRALHRCVCDASEFQDAGYSQIVHAYAALDEANGASATHQGLYQGGLKGLSARVLFDASRRTRTPTRFDDDAQKGTFLNLPGKARKKKEGFLKARSKSHTREETRDLAE